MTTDTSTEAVERRVALADTSHFRIDAICAALSTEENPFYREMVHDTLRALSRERDEWKKRAELARSELLNIDVSYFPPGQHHQRKMIYTAIHRLDPAVKIDDKYFERPQP